MVKMTTEESTRKCVSLLLECSPFRTRQLTVAIKQGFTLALERKNLKVILNGLHIMCRKRALSQSELHYRDALLRRKSSVVNMEKSIKLRHAVSVGPLEPSQYIG